MTDAAEEQTVPANPSSKWIVALVAVVHFVSAACCLEGKEPDDALPRGALQRFGSGRFHVKGNATQVQLSMDGSLIFAQSGGELVVMNRESGRTVNDVRLQPGRGNVGRIASSSDGQWLAIAITDEKAMLEESCRIVLLNTETRQRKVLRSSGLSSTVLFLKFSPDNKTLLAGTDGHGLVFWNLETADEIVLPPVSTQLISAAAFSPDGTMLMVLGENVFLRWKWQSKERPVSLAQHVQMRPSLLEYSPNGKWVLAGYPSADGLYVLNAMTGESAWSLQPSKNSVNPVTSMAFTKDGRFVAIPVTELNRVDLWDLESRRKVGSLPCWRPRTVAISRDQRWLITAGDSSKVTVFDFDTRRAVNIEADGHDGWVTKVRFARDGRSMASASYDGSVIVWDVATGVPSARLAHGQGNLVTGLAMSPDGGMIVTSTLADRTMRVWKRTTQQFVMNQKRQLKENANWFDIKFSPDGSRFVTWDSGCHIFWWNSSDGKLLEALTTTLPEGRADQDDAGPSGQLSADASRLIVAAGGHLHDFDTKSGTLQHQVELNGLNDAIVLAPDGKSIASTSIAPESNGENVIVKVQEFPSLSLLQQFTVRGVSRVRMAFSPDSQFLACSGNPSHTMIEIMNLKTGQVSARITEVPQFALLQFSPSGKRLISAHSDSTMILWDLTKFAIND